MNDEELKKLRESICAYGALPHGIDESGLVAIIDAALSARAERDEAIAERDALILDGYATADTARALAMEEAATREESK